MSTSAYEALREKARKWLYNPEHPNECATQGEVDDLQHLLEEVRAEAFEEVARLAEDWARKREPTIATQIRTLVSASRHRSGD